MRERKREGATDMERGRELQRGRERGNKQRESLSVLSNTISCSVRTL